MSADETAKPGPGFLDVDSLIADRRIRIVVVCGAGGVGKTTTAAALAVRAAESGRKVVVLTIDPAKRLAQSLGVEELDNTPRPVVGIGNRQSAGDETNGGDDRADQRSDGQAGSLDAMMLDMKRTFDEVVAAHASPDAAASIMQNPFYIALSSQFAGTQEYMAMEKLGQLHAAATESGSWDLIVVDTPPARSALDFLDAPEHLSSLLDGRFIGALRASGRSPFRLVKAGLGLVVSALNKVLGGRLLTDLQSFVAAFEAIFGGFRERATKTFQLLASEQTTFFVVATPHRDALREAAYFVDRLSDEEMPLAGLVVNRVTRSQLDLSAERALIMAEDLDPETHRVEIAALRQHAETVQTSQQERLLLDRFAAHRAAVSWTSVPALDRDVTELAALRRVGDLLAAQD